MTNPTAPLLTESEVSEIETVNKTYRIDWRYPNHRKHIDALIRDWRALKEREKQYAGVLSDRLREMRALGELVDCAPEDDTDDHQPCGTCRSCLTTENAALREQLTQAQRTITAL